MPGGYVHPAGSDADAQNGEGNGRTPIMVFVSSFFMTVATILGAGILGLPVSLARCGFWPFFASFTLVLLMQCAAVFLVLELLQKVQAHQQRHTKGQILEALIDGEEKSTLDSSMGPDLGTMGNMYLPAVVRPFFAISVLFLLVAVLCMYSMAGAQAYQDIFGIRSYTPVVIVFHLVMTTVVIFGQRLLDLIVSFITLGKGVLLLMMIGITGFLASQIGNSSKDDWEYSVDSVLISTVALGGVANTMPVYYEKIKNSPSDIRKYRLSVMLGIVACFFANVLWALFITMSIPSSDLHVAHQKGQIATIPLTSIIKNRYPSYMWISLIVQIFISVSITVSFVALGSALKHVIDGYAHALVSWKLENPDKGPAFFDRIATNKLLCRSILYVVFFGATLGIAIAFPESFDALLGNWVSLLLNLECGVFISMMMFKARKDTIPIPFKMNDSFLMVVAVIVFVYFGAVCVFDLTAFLCCMGSSGDSLCCQLAGRW